MNKRPVTSCWQGRFFLSFLIMLLCACTPTTPRGGGAFFPPEPEAPRLQYLTSFGSGQDLTGGSNFFSDILLGSDTRSLKNPYGVTFDGGDVLIADPQLRAYVVFRPQGKNVKIAEIVGEKLALPLNVKVDAEGLRYLTDPEKKSVSVYSRDHQLVRKIVLPKGAHPVDVIIAGDKMIVTNGPEHNLLVLDKRSGAPLGTIGKSGELAWPVSLTMASENSFYVVDTGRSKIFHYTLEGELLGTIGNLGDIPGTFTRPRGIAVDRSGNVYVSDLAFENIQLFDREGRLLLFFGEPGNKIGNLNMPSSLAIDYASAPFFQQYAAPGFQVEYVLAAVDRLLSLVHIFGFGRMEGVVYDDPVLPVVAAKVGDNSAVR